MWEIFSTITLLNILDITFTVFVNIYHNAKKELLLLLVNLTTVTTCFTSKRA